MAVATADHLLALTRKLLESIVAGDWKTYTSLVAYDITCFEPEARGQLVEGLPFHEFYFKLGAGGHMGSGAQWMSWVRRSDLVRLLQWLLESDTASGAYNGTAPEPVTNREFARTLGAVLKRPAVMTTPAFVLKLMFGEMAEALLLTGQRVLPVRAEAEGFVFQHRELEAALRDLLR